MARDGSAKKALFWQVTSYQGVGCDANDSGLLLDDGVVKPLPPVTRALIQTKAALEAMGHAVIEFHMYAINYTLCCAGRVHVLMHAHVIQRRSTLP